jgi:hypothetical protein
LYCSSCSSKPFVPRDHNYLELRMRRSMFVSTNRLEHANPFILIAGKDFGTQNGTQESKNMWLLLSWLVDKILEPKMVPKNPRTCYSFYLEPKMPSKKEKVNQKFGCKIGIQEQQMQPKTQDFVIGVMHLHKDSVTFKSSGLSLLGQYWSLGDSRLVGGCLSASVKTWKKLIVKMES